MPKFSDIRSKMGLIGKELKIGSLLLNDLLDLMEKGVISKPDTLFKNLMPKVALPKWYPFMFFDFGLKSYLLMDVELPLGKELDGIIELNQKNIEKAEGKNKEFLEILDFFYSEWKKTTEKVAKGYAAGLCKCMSTGDNGLLNMGIKNSGLKVSGKVKKGKIGEDIAALKYSPTTKQGQVLSFVEVEDESVLEKDLSESDISSSSVQPKTETPQEKTSEKPTKETLAKQIVSLKEDFVKMRQAEHDMEKVKQLFLSAKQWATDFQQLSKDDQMLLHKHKALYQEIGENIEDIGKLDNAMSKNVDDLVQAVTQFVKTDRVSSDALLLKNAALKEIQELEKMTKAVNATGIAEQCAEIKKLLA